VVAVVNCRAQIGSFFVLKAFIFSGLQNSPIVKALVIALFGAALISGCAYVEEDLSNDPLEEVNRSIFDLNNELDNSVFEPVAQAYVENVPDTLRFAVNNFVKFLKTPVIFLNNVLQGNLDGAGNTISRFLVNGITGFAGTADIAADSGVPHVKEDFGQTLAVWGFGEGPYIMMPILGPMNVRDGIGKFVDSFFDPFSTVVNEPAADWTRRVLAGVDTRANLLDVLDDLERTSLDYYAAIRSLYRQRRSDEITNGKGDAPLPVPNISFDSEVDKSGARRSNEAKSNIGFDDDEKLKIGAQVSLNLEK
jgi:phospholipid-binding lipoprotein MlaA